MYECLVYLAPDFNPDINEVRTVCASVTINDKEILNGTTQEWQPAAVQHAIYSKIDTDEPITSIKVDLINSYIRGAKV